MGFLKMHINLQKKNSAGMREVKANRKNPNFWLQNNFEKCNFVYAELKICSKFGSKELIAQMVICNCFSPG